MKNIDPETLERHFLYEMHFSIRLSDEQRFFRFRHFDTLIVDNF